MANNNYILSKSTFVKGNQCAKALYLNRFHKELKEEITEAQEAIFAQGTNVGLLAQGLFPGGIDLSPEDYTQFAQAVEETKKALADGKTILYEPAFIFNEVLCALDIMTKDRDGWNGYEVKSSTEVKETFILDSALQYYVITNSGIKLKDFFIVYINNQYVKKGHIDIKQLFAIESVHEQILELQPFIKEKISELKVILEKKQIPQVDIGEHCSSPYPCDFAGHCWKHVPENSVFNIANLRSNKKFELYKQGIIEFGKIPSSYPLSEKQWQQVNCELKQDTIIDKVKIGKFLSGLSFPLRFLDFETFQVAVPVYDGCRPYQQLVFQYSLHKKNSVEGETEHFEFLAEANGIDPRPDFIKNLIRDCGDKGDILVYNIGFERGKIKSLMEDFPEYAGQLQKIVDRLKDLMIPFFERMYYSPEMRGSYSIKQVLPALVPELSYEGLEIAEGGTASATYASMVQGTFEGDVLKTRKALLDYCKLDTYAMVKIVGKLNSVK